MFFFFKSFSLFVFQEMGVLDSFHQNVILNGIDDLVSYAFRRSRITECENVMDYKNKFGDHKMVKYSFPSLLDECPSCHKVERGSCEEALLCKSKLYCSLVFQSPLYLRDFSFHRCSSLSVTTVWWYNINKVLGMRGKSYT